MARPRIYDWDTIFAGTCRLRQGRDYEVPTRDMQSAIYAEAKRRGLNVGTSVCRIASPDNPGDEITVTRKVRAYAHDWDSLLDGQPHPVFASDLRTTTPQSFVRQVRRAAAKRGVGCRVKLVENGVWVQALPKG